MSTTDIPFERVAPLKKLKKQELVNRCAQKGLPIFGKKEDLIGRLLECDGENNNEDDLPNVITLPQTVNEHEEQHSNHITLDNITITADANQLLTTDPLQLTMVQEDDGVSSNASFDVTDIDLCVDPFGGFEDGIMSNDANLICYECDESGLV